jgi:hypothetical protein
VNRAPYFKEQVDRSRGRWAGRQASNATIRALDAVEQWTVQFRGGLSRLEASWREGDQPMCRRRPAKSCNTRRARRGSARGSAPSRMYVTPLRQHGQLWSRIVIGLSAIGTFVAVLGLTIGLWTFSPSKRYRRQSRPARSYIAAGNGGTQYSLSVGMAAVTWVFSGVPTDHFRCSGPAHTDAVAKRCADQSIRLRSVVANRRIRGGQTRERRE